MLNTIPLQRLATWQEELAGVVSDARELLALLELEPSRLGLSEAAAAAFPLRVPRPFLARMRRGDPADPLLLQVLPQALETAPVPGFVRDPLGEGRCNPAPGLLHKYHGRALLMPTSSCAIHCRYCFRRHFPYAENNPGRKQWSQALDYLRRDPGIEEVILSGGDPLAAPDRHLAWLAGELEAIPHLRRLRIHTRLPVMIPQRVNAELCDWLGASRLAPVVVIHSNHARELDPSVDAACGRLRESGAILLNQSVLLRGINDSLDALEALGKRLFQAGVLPYYLHLLDRTEGTAHFEVGEAEALALMAALRARLPGYLVPRLVREVSGMPAKSPVEGEAGDSPE